MSLAGRRTLAVMAIGVLWVAGCAPATPSPSGDPASARPPTAQPSPTVTPGLAAEMEVKRVDPELTDTILEFASDGESILFSSGIAEDAARGASPDLWHLNAFADDPPDVLWANPARDHDIVKIAGDLGTVAFVDMPRDGTPGWKLWLIARDGEDAILLDEHPGDAAVPGFVPSFSIQESTVAWTAFDAGPDGPVSQLVQAHGPDWEPTVLLERPAADAELWFPSISGSRIVYCEVAYSEDGASDERTVHVLDLAAPGTEPVPLSHSGLATMPVLTGDTVIWKEADPGFSMFNWGRLWRHEIGGPGSQRLDTAPLDYVNYPSAGSRFVAWWSADAFTFGVFDLLEDRPRVIERYSGASGANVLRPHIAWDLLAWLYVEGEGPDSVAELRYALMPPMRSPN